MRKPRKIKDQFVLIYWKDAAIHGSNQFDEKEAKAVGLVKGISGGILVSEDKEQITVCADWFPEDNQFRCLNSYPKSGISKIVRYYFKKAK